MMVRRRCAIYTRKSTEDGLDQAFNSLDAQRESCAAYILSQTHEGWEVVQECYDDGGWSGGTMVRPALKQLLDDVAAGKIDVIVVYKVDRLTRSLADFARIVDTLDKAGASFVSVTQAFNTTSSMGRLTLNVLLSFAQFEREVTSERIRDKVAASKRKGIFMGGPVPIGYRLESRKLIIQEAEAATVRTIFRRYVELQSIGNLADTLAADGVLTKKRVFRDGRTVGGIPFTTGPLAALLKNPVYIGQVRQGDALYNGEQEAIIGDELWNEVQANLATNRHERRLGSRARYPSLLTGMITDPDGRPMSPTFASRGAQRHHYYVSRLGPGENRKSAWRIPAREIDRIVLTALEERLAGGCSLGAGDEDDRTSIASLAVPQQRSMLLQHQAVVWLQECQLSVTFGDAGDTATSDIPISIARRGAEVRIIQSPGGKPANAPDAVLLKLVVLARAAQQAQLSGADDPLVAHYSKAHRQQLLRISWLAPDILSSICEGRQPATLTGRRLLRATNIPLAWAEQRVLLGYA
ncbi:MAG: recombinase family protein [Sphingomonas sp.]|uniref:recombinase family protein n=1 Tax=Sphingomonas sp. TaxID=28214 RepID=UPI00180D9A72|nr:recombinase family protein [Sphingomonas sp.]MBA3667722.1 recombinase family protein [Sphingomonas sp.]